jgi:hypothetical protein
LRVGIQVLTAPLLAAEVVEHLVARHPEYEAPKLLGVLGQLRRREHICQRGLNNVLGLIAVDTPSDGRLDLAV